ncbi:MAG: M20 family metallopeptidase [Clostridia bacterium]|nr:M20 family metallopeptidase [Clostridia bacterium]
MGVVTSEIFEYAVKIRRELHMHPEVGFELYKTCELVKRELKSMGIPFTERFGKCSVVGYIGDNPKRKTLALRADMDALPIQEKTNLPYASTCEGKMHACAHDAHTANLLATAKILKARENELSCNIRLIFQPSEEGEISGAKMMVDNGVMDGADRVIGIHSENTLDAGTIAVRPSEYMAACIPINLRFFGKSAHATLANTGVDAIAMSVEAYLKLKGMVAEEAGETTPYIWSVGSFKGGQVHNAIADFCESKISFRFYDEGFALRVMKRAEEICNSIAEKFGGKAEVDWHISARAVINDEETVEMLRSAIEKEVPVKEDFKRMGSEDFCWYLTKASGAFFRFGTKNPASDKVTRPHNNDFVIDESGIRAATTAFVLFALQYGK